MQQQITISGYHWPDIFDLPCVESIHKSYIAIDEKGDKRRVQRHCAKLRPAAMTDHTSDDFHPDKFIAFTGDTLVQHDSGFWELIRKPSLSVKKI